MPWSFQAGVSNYSSIRKVEPVEADRASSPDSRASSPERHSSGSEAEVVAKAQKVKMFLDSKETWDNTKGCGNQTKTARPASFLGAEWWQDFILDAGEFERSSLPAMQTEMFKTNSSYSGAMLQVPVCEALCMSLSAGDESQT